MLFRTTDLRAGLAEDVVGLHHGGDEVVGVVLPPGGEGTGAGELPAEVRVVGHCGPLGPRPDVSLQEALVRSVGLPGCPEHGVVRGRPEGLPHHGSRLGVLRPQSDSPATAEDLNAVGRVVPHEVEVMLGVEPLSHGRLLPAVDPGVQVPGQEGVHLGVQRREEPPVHGEDLADVTRGRIVFDPEILR